MPCTLAELEDQLRRQGSIPVPPTSPDVYLSSETVLRDRNGCCPLSGNRLPEVPGLILVSRHRLRSASTLFLGVGTASQRELAELAGRLPAKSTMQ